MTETTYAAHRLARHIFALEVAASPAEHPPDVAMAVEVATRVFAKLNEYLVKLIGVGGFEAVLARAHALSRKDIPWLDQVRVDANARLEGFETGASSQTAQEVERGTCVVLAHLLEVVMTFIGEYLTVRILRDIWPGMPEAQEIPEAPAGGTHPVDPAKQDGREARPEESGA